MSGSGKSQILTPEFPSIDTKAPVDSIMIACDIVFENFGSVVKKLSLEHQYALTNGAIGKRIAACQEASKIYYQSHATA